MDSKSINTKSINTKSFNTKILSAKSFRFGSPPGANAGKYRGRIKSSAGLSADAFSRGGAAMESLRMSGLTPDIYTLEDILNPELPEYKLYLFFSPVAITPEQVEAIQKKAYRKGTVVMLVGPTGILPPSDPGNAVYLGNGIAVGHRLESPITLYFPETMNFYDSVTGKKLQSGTQIELDNKPGECKVILYEKPDSSDKVNGR